MTRLFISILSIFLINWTNKVEEDVNPGHLKSELVSEVKSIQPGVPFWVGLSIKLDEGWHINWLNPGDAGLATSIKWKLPEGFTAGEIEWPNPKRLSFPPLVLFGYEGRVLLPVKITPPKTLLINEKITISAACNWVVCGDACVPGKAQLTLVLPATNETPKKDPQWSGEFSSTKDKSPVTNADLSVKAIVTENSIVLNVAPVPADWQEIAGLIFFPETQGIIQNSSEQILTKEKGAYQLRIQRDKMGQSLPQSLSGVLIVGKKGKHTVAKGYKIEVLLSRGSGTQK